MASRTRWLPHAAAKVRPSRAATDPLRKREPERRHQRSEPSSPSALTPDGRDRSLETMPSRTRQMAAGEFKARCPAILDEVAASKRPLIITKRGRPVAKVVPLAEAEPLPRKGLIVRQGDLISPIGSPWDAER